MITFIDAAADLLLGSTCAGCRSPGWGVCRGCLDLLRTPPHAFGGPDGLPVVAAGPYRPVLEHLIPRYKDDGALHLERLLAELLAGALAVARPAPDTLLVPVPSLPRNVRARGFDHARRLARRLASDSGLKSAALISRDRRGHDQAGLGRSDRSTNLECTMKARPPRYPVLVIDDVITTGATLREACRSLERVGADVLGAVVIAQVDDYPPGRTKA